MMSGHGANPIFFNNKNNKDWTSRTFATHPLRPITSHFCLTTPLPLKVDVMCDKFLQIITSKGTSTNTVDEGKDLFVHVVIHLLKDLINKLENQLKDKQ